MTTPPPQNQNPFAQQGGNAYGQQPQAPYGQPPQAPYGQQPGPYGQQPMAPYPGAPEPAPRRSKLKMLRKFGIPVVVIIMAVVGWIASRDDAETAAVGDCVMNSGTATKPDVEVVDCKDAKAKYKVIKKVDGAKSAMATCSAVEGATGGYEQSRGSDSFVLCFSDNKEAGNK
ncbi:hypothetical protein ACH4U6_13510 [Streptomyces netropsis]|uniref:LppU/SCO3897 family protein n=1 Tax=Streptomyces netropsis TaxID=55404 RepID=UPI00379A9C35